MLRPLATASIVPLARLFGAGIGFLTQLMLARVMGAHELGLFYAATSLAVITGLVVSQGYQQISARFAARYRSKNAPALFGAFAGQATRDALLIGAVAGVLLTGCAEACPGLATEERVIYTIGGWLATVMGMLTIYTGFATATRHFSLSYMPEGLFRPLLFFIVIAAAVIFKFHLDAIDVTVAFALITIAIAAIVIPAMSARMPRLRWSAPRALSSSWRREARLLMLQAVFTSYFGDIGVLVAVPYLVPAEVAVFGLCLKIALLVGYFVQVAQEMALPDLADSRHAHDVVGMHRSVRRAILLPAALTISAMTVIALFGDRILSIFGPQFASGQWALVILIATQMVRALAGPSTYLMTLSGKQTLNAAITASVIAVLLIASVVLIPPFGIEGAALAVFLSYASWIMAAIITLRRLGEPRIDALALLAARGSALKRG